MGEIANGSFLPFPWWERGIGYGTRITIHDSRLTVFMTMRSLRVATYNIHRLLVTPLFTRLTDTSWRRLRGSTPTSFSGRVHGT